MTFRLLCLFCNYWLRPAGVITSTGEYFLPKTLVGGIKPNSGIGARQRSPPCRGGSERAGNNFPETVHWDTAEGPRIFPVSDDLSWGIKHGLITKKQGLMRVFGEKYSPVKNQKYQLKHIDTLDFLCGSNPPITTSLWNVCIVRDLQTFFLVKRSVSVSLVSCNAASTSDSLFAVVCPDHTRLSRHFLTACSR